MLFGLSRPEPAEGLTIYQFINLTFSFRLPRSGRFLKWLVIHTIFKLTANLIFLKKKLRFVLFQDATISFIDLET